MSKRSAVEEAKQRLKDKLQDINCQASLLHSVIDETKHEAEKCAQMLLEEKKKSSFFKEYPSVNQKLEDVFNKLLLIKDAVYSLDEEQDTDSSTSEDDDEDNKSVFSATTVSSEKTVIDTENKVTEKVDLDERPEDPSRSIEASKSKNYYEKIPKEEKSPDSIKNDQKEPVKSKINSAANEGLLEKDFGPKKAVSIVSMTSSGSESNAARKLSSRTASPVFKASPVIRARKLPSTSPSMSPVIPRVLSEDVTVPYAIFSLDIPQTVMVTEINNPWNFYVQIMNPAYDHFMEEMCLHFSKQANQGYKGGISNMPSVGAYCCAKSPVDKTWYRARITEVKTVEEKERSVPSESLMSAFDDPLLNGIQVCVFLVDEGSEINVPVCHLRPLEQQFSYLPRQAIHCILAGVAPMKCEFTENAFDDATWSAQSVDWFNMSIKAEGTFTGYLHAAITNKDRYPIDLYVDGLGGYHDVDSPIPSIDSSIGYMMLLVKMAKPAKIWDSHLKKHFPEIDQLLSEDQSPIAVYVDTEENVDAHNFPDEKKCVADEKIEVKKKCVPDEKIEEKKKYVSEEKIEDKKKYVLDEKIEDKKKYVLDEKIEKKKCVPDEKIEKKKCVPDEKIEKKKCVPDEKIEEKKKYVPDEKKKKYVPDTLRAVPGGSVKNESKKESVSSIEASQKVEQKSKKTGPRKPLDHSNSYAEKQRKPEADPRSMPADFRNSEVKDDKVAMKVPLVEKFQPATFENRYKMKEFEVGPEGFVQVLVSNVRDPSFFFVHLITPDVALFDAMMHELEQFYSNNDLPEPLLRLDIGNAVVTKFSEDGKWYRGVIRHLKVPDKGIARKSITDDEFVYEVLHVDFGSSEWVPASEIRPVVEKFFELPMETLPCCLAGISPMETSRDVGCTSSSSSFENEQSKNTSLKLNLPSKKKKHGSAIYDDEIEHAAGDEDYNEVFDASAQALPQKRHLKWSSLATKRFKELTLDDKPRIASLKEGSKHSRLPDEPCQIYLYNTNEDTDIFINNALVDESLAVSNVYTKASDRADQHRKQDPEKVIIREEELRDMVAKGCTKDLIIKGKESCTQPLSSELPTSPTSPTGKLMSDWNPMKEDFLSQRNAYTINTDDPAVATMGFAEPKRNICGYFLSRRGCYRGSACTREHARPDDISHLKLDAFCIKDQAISLPQIGSFVLVQVTSMLTPVHFYVRFPFGTKPIQEMLNVGHFADQFDDTDELYELQEEMTAKYSKMAYRNSDLIPFQPGELIAAKFEDDGQWYRCQIIAVLESKYEVFFIDYGNTETVLGKDTRKLLPEFLYLENQGVEAFLANVEMKASVAGEDNLLNDAKKCFQDCCCGDYTLLARVMSKAINRTLYLELYDKQTNDNINQMLLKTPYFQEIQNALPKPWDMSKAIAVNTSIVHMIPG